MKSQAKAYKRFTFKDDNLKIIFNRDRYCGFLINRTEKGIGFIPLINDYKLLYIFLIQTTIIAVRRKPPRPTIKGRNY